MKKLYCRYEVLSTGYISGSVPPQFSEDNKKPVDLLGSNGVMRLDNRNSLTTMIIKCKDSIERHESKNSIVSFYIFDWETDKVIFRSGKLKGAH